MAVMDAAIFEACDVTQPKIKYAKPDYKEFSRIILLHIFIGV